MNQGKKVGEMLSESVLSSWACMVKWYILNAARMIWRIKRARKPVSPRLLIWWPLPTNFNPGNLRFGLFMISINGWDRECTNSCSKNVSTWSSHGIQVNRFHFRFHACVICPLCPGVPDEEHEHACEDPVAQWGGRTLGRHQEWPGISKKARRLARWQKNDGRKVL